MITANILSTGYNTKDTKMGLSPTTKQRIAIVIDASKFVFQWGFIPAVLFLGFRKGADPGMPELTLLNLLWQ